MQPISLKLGEFVPGTDPQDPVKSGAFRLEIPFETLTATLASIPYDELAKEACEDTFGSGESIPGALGDLLGEALRRSGGGAAQHLLEAFGLDCDEVALELALQRTG